MKNVWLITKIVIGMGAILTTPVYLSGCAEIDAETSESSAVPEIEATATGTENVIETETEAIATWETITTEEIETEEIETQDTETKEVMTASEEETTASKEAGDSQKETNTETSVEATGEVKETTIIPSVPEENVTYGGEVHHGYATFYGAGPGGCCNLDDYENQYHTVAMNRPDYNEMNLAGAYLEVTDKDGDKINVMVTNELPEGNHGDLDLSTSAFGAIEPLETGKMEVSWKIIPLPTVEPIYYKFKPSSSQWWVEVQVRNQRYPIRSVEYLNADGEFVALERKPYNYYCAQSGMGTAGPVTFRVTDMYGHVLIDENIPIDTNEACIPGNANFPY